MISAITSYIWGAEEELCSGVTPPPEVLSEHEELENEWIFIRPQGFNGPQHHAHFNEECGSMSSETAESVASSDTWLVTPPQCFNGEKNKIKTSEIGPMENLLIEHPSMSIYQGSEEKSEKETAHDVTVARQETHKPVAGRLQVIKRQPLKDLNMRLIEQKNASPKIVKRNNMVHIRSHSTRKNKQYGRMSGKHVGMVGKRGS